MAINYPHVEERDGTYYVEGHRVPIISLIYHWNNGADPETIQRDFDTLTLAEVYSAIAFYLDHREKLDVHFKEVRAEETTILAAYDAKNQPFRDELRRRFKALQGLDEAAAS